MNHHLIGLSFEVRGMLGARPFKKYSIKKFVSFQRSRFLNLIFLGILSSKKIHHRGSTQKVESKNDNFGLRRRKGVGRLKMFKF